MILSTKNFHYKFIPQGYKFLAAIFRKREAELEYIGIFPGKLTLKKASNLINNFQFNANWGPSCFAEKLSEKEKTLIPNKRVAWRGSSRNVIPISNDLVWKVAKNQNGIQDNIAEWELFKNTKKTYLAPCLPHENYPLILTMERLEVPDKPKPNELGWDEHQNGYDCTGRLLSYDYAMHSCVICQEMTVRHREPCPDCWEALMYEFKLHYVSSYSI